MIEQKWHIAGKLVLVTIKWFPEMVSGKEDRVLTTFLYIPQ